MKKSKIERFRRLIEAALNEPLSDEVALEVTSLHPAWDMEGTYKTGDRVRYGGVLYKCLQDHSAQADWTPEAAVSLWARVLGLTVTEWVQPESTNPYQKGDRVLHNDVVWVSIVNDNVWEPGVYGWQEAE